MARVRKQLPCDRFRRRKQLPCDRLRRRKQRRDRPPQNRFRHRRRKRCTSITNRLRRHRRHRRKRCTGITNRLRRHRHRRAPGGDSGNLNFRSVFSKGSFLSDPAENRPFLLHRKTAENNKLAFPPRSVISWQKNSRHKPGVHVFVRPDPTCPKKTAGSVSLFFFHPTPSVLSICFFRVQKRKILRHYCKMAPYMRGDFAALAKTNTNLRKGLLP